MAREWQFAGGLPLGSQQVTVTATNCAGTLTCTSTVVVEDREALDPALGTCGALPAQGVLKKSVAASLSSAVLATYASTYAKTNGCPVSVGYSNLTCQNCLLGSPTVVGILLSICFTTRQYKERHKICSPRTHWCLIRESLKVQQTFQASSSWL